MCDDTFHGRVEYKIRMSSDELLSPGPYRGTHSGGAEGRPLKLEAQPGKAGGRNY